MIRDGRKEHIMLTKLFVLVSFGGLKEQSSARLDDRGTSKHLTVMRGAQVSECS